MEILDEYIINPVTVAIFHHYSEEGRLYSLVVEKDRIFLVRLSPLAIIKSSIHYYGHTFEGAEKATKKALGKISMAPVKISGKLGIYWFPTKSAKHEDCCWFAADHVKDYYSAGGKKLKVLFEGGYEVIIDSSFDSFERKLTRTHRYKNLMEGRANSIMVFTYAEPVTNFQIVRDPVRNHFRVEGQKNQKPR